MCVDYRALNDITIKNRAPIPNIDELRERLAGSKYFSKMDLREGFYNLRVRDQDTYKTAFRCRYGHFEFRVVPMGLSNSPAVFQSMMTRIFMHVLDVCVIIYLDDIVVYSKTQDDHARDLSKVFDILQEHKLHVKRSKCSFGQDEVEFCGHVANGTGISISKSKRLDMLLVPLITNVADVRSYLGSCVWFHNFIPDYAEITEPLSKLLRKGAQWTWGRDQQEAVSILIHLITTAPILCYFNPELPTKVYTDASDFAIGGYICQEHNDGWKPCTFWSRKLNEAELNYPVHEKELLALVAMVEKHSYWLLGVKFTCFTDHMSLRYLQTQEKLTRRQARWIITLQEFDMAIIYIEGEKNNIADLLSRSAAVAPVCAKCKNKSSGTGINSFLQEIFFK